MSLRDPQFTKGIFPQLDGAFCGRFVEYRKKPLASKFPFHDESLARKSKFLEQSGGGGGGGGWVCQLPEGSCGGYRSLIVKFNAFDVIVKINVIFYPIRKINMILDEEKKRIIFLDGRRRRRGRGEGGGPN